MPSESATIRPEAGAQQQARELIAEALERRASDLHLEPTDTGHLVRYRIDGLLETHATLEPARGRAVVTCLMVMAELLTYRVDVPQEGRIRIDLPGHEAGIDLRLAIMPTTHGVRAAVRLPTMSDAPRTLDQLGMPDAVLAGLRGFAQSEMGLLLVVGPAGSGKTTTIYALLRHLMQTQPGLSIVSMEDPVEADLQGVTQIQVTPFGELTYERALRSVLRQDPQVLAIGEIRDARTASIVVEAALTGHRVISTMHAGHPASTVARLTEMDVEPYQVASALYGVVAQRLLRKTADGHGQGDDRYHGRFPVGEFARMDGHWRRLVLEHADAGALRDALAQQSDFETMRAAADRAVAEGQTDADEVARLFGPAPGD